jgi:urease accessory protein
VGPIDALLKINQLCDAFTSNHVANRASRLQGQAFLIAAERTFGGEPLKALRAAFRNPDLPAHFAPLFGAVGALLEIERAELANLFMFLHLRGWIASAVRLGIVGPMEGQRTQFQLSDYAGSVARRCSSLTLDDVAQAAPLLDLMQANHDRLYSRLFQS